MSDAVQIALITSLAGLLGAILVEMIRARKRADMVAKEMRPSETMAVPHPDAEVHGTLRDAVNRLEARIEVIAKRQHTDHDKLIRVETLLDGRT